MLSEGLIRKIAERIVTEVTEALPNDVINQSGTLASFISSGGREVVVTNAGSFASPAKFLVLCLRNMTLRNAVYFTSQELMYYVVPYDEGRESDIVIFVTPDGISTLNLLVDQVKWTGHKICAIIAGDSLPQTVKYKLSSDTVIHLKSGTSNMSQLLQMYVLTGIAVSRLVNRRGIRGKRLWDELTNINSVINDMVEQYLEDLLSIKEFMSAPHLITASPTMWVVGEYLAYSSTIKTQRFLAMPHEVRNFIRFVNRVLLATTDVEEYSMKELKGLTVTAATEFKELRIKTDPLTAPIYGLMLARALELLIEQ